MSPFARVFHVGHWSVATRIIVACVGIGLVFAGTVTAIAYVKASSGLVDQANFRLESDAVVVTTAVDMWTTAHLDMARTVAKYPVIIRALDGDAITPKDFAEVTAIANSIKSGATDTTGLTLLDARGISRFSLTATTIGLNLSNRDYWQHAIK